MLRLFFIEWLCPACVLVAAEPKTETTASAVAQEMKSFAGTWQMTVVQPEGATKDARRLVFQHDGTYTALDSAGKELWAGTFEIDPAETPRVWDHRSYDAKKEGRDVLGIYELNGDKLKVACVVGQWNEKKWSGKKRPTKFQPLEADVIIEFQRVRDK